MYVSAEAAPAEPAARREPDQARLWFDGALVDADAPQLPLTAHALHYGSGVFEGIRAYATADGGSAVFRLPEHLARMRRGCELLGIAFDVAVATDATLAVLCANREALGQRDAYVRPLAWCGSGTIGLDVGPQPKHLMVATFATAVHLAGTAVKLGVSSWRRNPASSLPPLKLCGGYVNSILAKHEARARGFDEALFVDADGRVVECTGANVFAVHGDSITAVEHPDALAGITRDTLRQLTGAASRAMSLDELIDADEVFVCGTAAEVTPIASLDGRAYRSSRIGTELAHAYRRVVRGEDRAHAHWLTHV
ncbi:aminotransferase class IV [Cognatilysobacter tabacisoli]|uniref:aminotransferase class IV n=1 Tax=Cognatilysobacter tabacisoli TaxID=2315424 RepID=UPI001300942D|nr:aminotransferase class IV [Lysobacter tabacisoli]